MLLKKWKVLQKELNILMINNIENCLKFLYLEYTSDLVLKILSTYL